MKVIAVPIRSLEEAKSRLSPALEPLERGALTLAMLEDVLDATLGIAGWTTWVISPDEAVLDVALMRGAEAIAEDKPPLSNAVRQLEGAVAARGADALAVLLGDTPLVTTEALTRALHTLGPVVVAPDDEDLGTNLLVRRPANVIRARFGAESFRKHLETAETNRIPAAVVRDPDLAFDLDSPSDILALLRSRRQGRTREVCMDMDLRARIAIHT